MKVWSLKALRKVLEGDPGELLDAFEWKRTPQGDRHWYDRYDGSEPLTDEDYAFLIRAANEHGPRRRRRGP